MDFAKASETFNIYIYIYPNPLYEEDLWDWAKWSAHGNILLTELFAATNNEVIIILWQVIFIGCWFNYDSIYLTPPDLIQGTVCLYPFELKWNNEIYEIFLCRHLYVKISMWKYEYIDTKVGTSHGCQFISKHKHKLFSNHQISPVNQTKTSL